MNLLIESAFALLLCASLIAYSTSIDSNRPDYSQTLALLAAKDAFDVIEEAPELRASVYSLESTGVSLELNAFLDYARLGTPAKCFTLKAGVFSVESGTCPSGSNKLVLRRIFFNDERFFTVELEAGY